MTGSTDVAVQFVTHDIHYNNNYVVINAAGEIVTQQNRIYRLNLIGFVRTFLYVMKRHGRIR